MIIDYYYHKSCHLYLLAFVHILETGWALNCKKSTLLQMCLYKEVCRPSP